MVSEVHEFVLSQIADGKTKKQVIDDLFISYVAISINELSSKKNKDVERFSDYLTGNLNDAIRLILNSAQFLSKNIEQNSKEIKLPEFQKAN